MKNNKVTVVTVTYNCEQSIEKTILSVINQDYENIEYIIIDGKSTDRTLSIINEYKDHISHLKSEQDEGIFDAMNKGIIEASGDWIIFLNSGDLFISNDTISRIMNNKLEKYQVIYGDTAYIADGNFYSYKATPFFLKSKSYTGMGICHQSILVKTKIAKRLKFDINYKVAADYNMIKEIYNQGGKFFRHNEIISAIDTNGFSIQNKKIQRREIMSICDVKPNIHLSAYFIFSDIKKFLREILKKNIRTISPNLFERIRISKKGTYKIQ